VQTRSRILDSDITKQISTVSLDQHCLRPSVNITQLRGKIFQCWPRHQSIFVYCSQRPAQSDRHGWQHCGWYTDWHSIHRHTAKNVSPSSWTIGVSRLL